MPPVEAITRPLLILSAWALAGALVLALAAVFHPPLPRQPGSTATADHAAAGTDNVDTGQAPAQAETEASRTTRRTSTDKPN
jgi:hypothetical protein